MMNRNFRKIIFFYFCYEKIYKDNCVDKASEMIFVLIGFIRNLFILRKKVGKLNFKVFVGCVMEHFFVYFFLLIVISINILMF